MKEIVEVQERSHERLAIVFTIMDPVGQELWENELVLSAEDVSKLRNTLLR